MSKKLIIAGGGTGGHIFPGIAIAQEWTRQGGLAGFVGTVQGQEKDIVPRQGFPIAYLKIGRLKGAGLKQKIATLAGLPQACLAAGRILRREKPAVVLGIGGYASGPMVLAAKVAGIKTAITDQNVHPGMTNRFLGKIVDKVFLAFAESGAFFPAKKCILAGNPVRSQIVCRDYVAPQDIFRLFIFGGSQGAVTLNQKMLEAVDRLQNLWPRLEITHQAGKTDLAEIESFYRKRGIKADVRPFFDDMSAPYQKAHLVISRAGAGTLTELALSGRPAILVPYPFAADDHQTKNANVFVNSRAAWLMPQKDLIGESLAQKIRHLWEQPQELIEAAAKMSRLAKPDAARMIVEKLRLLAG